MKRHMSYISKYPPLSEFTNGISILSVIFLLNCIGSYFFRYFFVYFMISYIVFGTCLMIYAILTKEYRDKIHAQIGELSLKRGKYAPIPHGFCGCMFY